MRGIFQGVILVAGAALSSSNAQAMSVPAPRCHVEDAGKLPAGAGADIICAEIDRAVAAASPHARYTVSVKVLSPSRLLAIPVVNGNALPEQNFAVMDRNLSPDTVRRFAGALATEIAKAARE